MKTMMDDFRHGLPDCIEKIITKKLDEQDAISLHANPTNIDEASITGTKVPIIQMQIKVLQEGEPLKRLQIPQ